MFPIFRHVKLKVYNLIIIIEYIIAFKNKNATLRISSIGLTLGNGCLFSFFSITFYYMKY